MQLSELRELQRLELHGIYKAASCDVLARPPSLRCLRLQHCWAPPPSLSKLTALTALAIRQELIVHVFEDIPEEGFMAEWNQDKLQALADTRAFLASGCTQLRHLAALHLHFTADTLPITALPANLGACLPTLQRFAWTGSSEGLLPAGLTGLQQLVLPEALAQRSVAQLAAAAGLECLALCYPRLSSPEAQGEALHHQAAFAARLLPQLPSLRRLQLPGLSSCSQQRWDELGALLPSVTLSPFDRYQFEQWP